MIREMEKVEEGYVRTLIAKLDYEDQTLWRKQPKVFEECLRKSSALSIGRKIEGKSAIFVAEEDSKIVGLCWCIVVDRGVDRQGEIAEFYVEKDFRNRCIGKDLVTAAKQFLSMRKSR